MLKQGVAQAVLLLFIQGVLFFSHVAENRFLGKRGKFRSNFFFASAKDKGGGQLLQLCLYTGVSLAERNYELSLEVTLRTQQVRLYEVELCP